MALLPAAVFENNQWGVGKGSADEHSSQVSTAFREEGTTGFLKMSIFPKTVP